MDKQILVVKVSVDISGHGPLGVALIKELYRQNLYSKCGVEKVDFDVITEPAIAEPIPEPSVILTAHEDAVAQRLLRSVGDG